MFDVLPNIRTSRLVLRAPTGTDAADLFEVFANREVTRFWSSPAMTDLSEAEALIREIQAYFEKKTLFQWVATVEDGRVIGTGTLGSIDYENRRAEIGFAIGRAYWGRGYGLEIARALVELAFGRMGIARIEADVDPENARSLALLRKLGFVREGYMPERYRVGGGTQDSVWLGLLASRWPPADERASSDLRLMRSADRDSVVALLAAQLEEHDVVLGKTGMEEAIDGLVDRPDRGAVLVIEQEERVVGVAYVSFAWTLEHGGHVAWLEELYVALEHRGRGLGGRLLEAAIAHAESEGAKAMDLEVDETHRDAERLYARFGFEPLSRARWQKK